MMDIRKWLRKGKNATDENKEDDERHVVGGGGGGGGDDHVDEISTEAGQSGQASNVSPAAGASAQAAGLPRSAAASGPAVTVKPLPDDLGSERPNQVVLQWYPCHLFQNKSRSFVSSWYQTNEWLEYSVQTDAAFCYPCRKFNTARGPGPTRGTCLSILTDLTLMMSLQKDRLEPPPPPPPHTNLLSQQCS